VSIEYREDDQPVRYNSTSISAVVVADSSSISQRDALGEVGEGRGIGIGGDDEKGQSVAGRRAKVLLL
jgi:hypothetical protein